MVGLWCDAAVPPAVYDDAVLLILTGVPALCVHAVISSQWLPPPLSLARTPSPCHLPLPWAFPRAVLTCPFASSFFSAVVAFAGFCGVSVGVGVGCVQRVPGYTGVEVEGSARRFTEKRMRHCAPRERQRGGQRGRGGIQTRAFAHHSSLSSTPSQILAPPPLWSVTARTLIPTEGTPALRICGGRRAIQTADLNVIYRDFVGCLAQNQIVKC